MKAKQITQNILLLVITMISVILISMCLTVNAYGDSEPKLNKSSLTLAFGESYNLVLKVRLESKVRKHVRTFDSKGNTT